MRALRNLIVIGMAATLMACGGGAKKKIKVGFAETGAESAWRTAHTQSIKAEAEKRGAIDLKFADGQGKQENQIKALRSFIAQQCDVIILSPLVETGWEPVLKEAKKAKIPVLLLDRRIKVDDDSLYVSFIGSDFVQEGKMVGEWLKKKMNGKAKIVELEGTPGSAPAIDRKKGFLEVIKDSPDMKVIASQSGDFRRSNGKEVMEALLKKYGAEIEVVFAHNDDMALGAIQAIEEAGKKPGKDIIVVSIDAIKDAFQAMIDGKLNCSVECNPLQGPAAFDAVEKIMKGETMPKTIIIKDECYDQSVAKATIASRKY